MTENKEKHNRAPPALYGNLKRSLYYFNFCLTHNKNLCLVYLTRKSHNSSCQIQKLKYTFSKYDGGLPNKLTLTSTHSHTRTHIPGMSKFPYLPIEAWTRRRVTGSRNTLSPFPIRSLCVWMGAWALHHLLGVLLTQTLFPDLGPTRDESAHHTTSFIHLITLHRVMIKADPPLLPALCYHIK